MNTPKHTLPFGNTTALDRILKVVSPIVDLVVVSIGTASSPPPLGEFEPKIKTVRDSVPGRGPLQGLCDALSLLKREFQTAFLLACDYPLITPELLSLLHDRLGENDAAVPFAGGRVHPLVCALRPNAFAGLADELERGERRVIEAFNHRRLCLVGEDDIRARCNSELVLATANTPDELAQLREMAKVVNLQ